MNSYDVFISYRRTNGLFLAHLLYDHLTRDGYSVFFDVESMRSGKFNEQIYESIDHSSTMVVVLPPRGLNRCKNEEDWVRKEIAHGIRQHKTLIPVMMQGFQWPGELPEDIRELPEFQGVSAENNVSINIWYPELRKYIDQHLNPEKRRTVQTTDSEIRYAALTDKLALACENNSGEDVLGIIDEIRYAGFLTEEILDMAISHFNEIGDHDTAVDLIRKMLEAFPESKTAYIRAVNPLMNEMGDHYPTLLRKVIDWLMDHPPFSPMLYVFDIRCDLVSGQEESAYRKLEDHRNLWADDPELSQAVSSAFIDHAYRICKQTERGKLYYDSPEDYGLWQKYMETARQMARDKEVETAIEKEMKKTARPGFVFRNIPGMIVLAVLALTIKFPLNLIFVALFVLIAVFSFLPALQKFEYRKNGHPSGIYQIVYYLAAFCSFPLLVIKYFLEGFFGIDTEEKA